MASAAAALATRSIKKDAKLWALDAAVRMVDLTTLEGRRHPGQGPGAVRQGPAARPGRPGGAAGRRRLRLPRPGRRGPGRAGAAARVKVASVATAFPSGRASLAVKLADAADAVAAGADEVDMVIDRGAFLAGRYGLVSEEIRAVREACGAGAPQGDPGDRRAGHAGQRGPGLVAGHAVRRGLHQDLDRQGAARPRPRRSRWSCWPRCATSRRSPGAGSGSRWPAGSAPPRTRSATWCWSTETAGPDWLTPALFRIGASSLLNDLLMQRRKQLTGVYPGPDYFTVD